MTTTSRPALSPLAHSPCSEFLAWSHKAGYSTCTSDIQFALWDAWQASRAKQEVSRNCASTQMRCNACGHNYFIPNAKGEIPT